MTIIRNEADYATAAAAGFGPVPHFRETNNNFAEACINDSSLDDLINCRTAEADETDMKAWGISADEWRDAQIIAIEHEMFCFNADH